MLWFVVPVEDRFGQQTDGRDRRLEFVGDVGDEIAADGFQPESFGLVGGRDQDESFDGRHHHGLHGSRIGAGTRQIDDRLHRAQLHVDRLAGHPGPSDGTGDAVVDQAGSDHAELDSTGIRDEQPALTVQHGIPGGRPGEGDLSQLGPIRRRRRVRPRLSPSQRQADQQPDQPTAEGDGQIPHPRHISNGRCS